MGLLDDAIREHLDLKRRRGADPAEIERDEREALGPVRRNRDIAPADDGLELSEPRGAPVGSAFDEPDDGIASDLVDEGDAYDDEGEFEFETAEHEAYTGEPEPAPDAPDVDDAHATRVMRAADIPEPGERTTEFDVEGALADDDDAFADRAPGARDDEDDDDMLEETPEFLQDTPDHDRLWFEQRPPRDFDFDG